MSEERFKAIRLAIVAADPVLRVPGNEGLATTLALAVETGLSWEPDGSMPTIQGGDVLTEDPIRLLVAATLRMMPRLGDEEECAELSRRIRCIEEEDGTQTWDAMPCPLCDGIDCDPRCPLRVCRPDQKWRMSW